METYGIIDREGEVRLLQVIHTPEPQTQEFTRIQIERMIEKMDMQITNFTEQKALWETRLTEIDKLGEKKWLKRKQNLS